jgi:protein-disulfide isomerase
VAWSFREWWRQKFWTPRVVHVSAVLALAVIILINVDWVMSGGQMWTQRYVVVALFGIFPYVVYLVFLGPKFLGRRRAPAATRDVEADSDWATAPPPRQPRSPIGFVLGIGAVVLLLAATRDIVLRARTPRAASTAVPTLAPLRDPLSLVPTARGVELGDPDAPVTIVAFGDYQCPACAAFALRFKPRIDTTFAQTGQARFVFYDLPLVSRHPNAFLAARAGRCAEDQDRFWEFHEETMRNQDEWSALAAPYEAFDQYADAVGVDVPDFRACLASDRHTDLVQANAELASKLGINSTPSIIVVPATGDPRKTRNYQFNTIAAAMREATSANEGN